MIVGKGRSFKNAQAISFVKCYEVSGRTSGALTSRISARDRNSLCAIAGENRSSKKTQKHGPNLIIPTRWRPSGRVPAYNTEPEIDLNVTQADHKNKPNKGMMGY